MFCEKCGKKLEDGVKFCPSCGNRVEIPENQTDTVYEQPEKSKKSRKKSKLPLVLIAVLAIILIVGGILYGTVGLNLQKDKLAVKIKKAGIPQYTEEMNEIVDEWDDFGIFSISDKRNDLHKLKKIVNYLDEYNAAADEYKSMNKEKEQYALDEDSYKEYENALHDCSDAIEQKNPESLINAVEIAKETLKDLKKADDSYVEDRVKMYEGLELKDAGDDVVSGYKKNLKEIQGLTGKGKKDYKAIKEAFSKMDQAISSMYLVIPGESQFVTTLDYPVYRSGLKEDNLRQFETLCGKNGGPAIMDDLVHSKDKLLQFTEKVTGEDGQVIGYLCANIEEQNLRYDYLEDPSNQELGQIELIEDGRIIAAREQSRMGNKFPVKKYKNFISHSEVTGADKENIYIYCEGSFSGCGIFASVKRSAVLGDLAQMRKYVFGVAAVFGLIAMLAAIYISRIVYKPVRKLMTAMQSIADGEMDTRAEVVSKDEIGLAAEEFNRMLDRIEELIGQLIQEEKKKKDAELEALQYQITPHFMYNTLNSIKCYAMIHNEKEIATVIGDFVELLQTCIRKKGTFLTVAEEIQVLKNYIHLQEFRNGEEYQAAYAIEREAEQCLIPRLILQPLVENALIHGLDLKNNRKHLTIEAYTSGSRLYMKVRDNGRGMTQEQIEELLKKKGKKTKGLTAVGIPNIQERLQLYYGTQAKLSLKSSGEGTEATIYLPVNRSEDEES